jgi:hypothetical protein
VGERKLAMGRPGVRYESSRPSRTFVQPQRVPSRRGTSWFSIWLPLVALMSLLALAPFWLVRLTERLIAR